MRDPEVVGLDVCRGKEGCDMETEELWQTREVYQNKSYGLADLLCKFVEIDSKSFTHTCIATSWMKIASSLLLLIKK